MARTNHIEQSHWNASRRKHVIFYLWLNIPNLYHRLSIGYKAYRRFGKFAIISICDRPSADRQRQVFIKVLQAIGCYRLPENRANHAFILVWLFLTSMKQFGIMHEIDAAKQQQRHLFHTHNEFKIFRSAAVVFVQWNCLLFVCVGLPLKCIVSEQIKF